MNRIINRQQELQLLNERFLQDERRPGQLAFIYGRRQVGKTALLLHWAQQTNRPYFYWVPSEGTAEEIEESLTRALVEWAHLDPKLEPFPDSYFRDRLPVAILHVAKEQPGILILDEFHRADDVNPALASKLKHLWDMEMEEAAVTVIMVGSDFGTALQILGYHAPLYLCCWTQYRIDPLPFATLVDFFPNYTPAERLGVYAVLGGIPGYLEQFDPEQSLEMNIRQHFFPPSAMFKDEAKVVLEGLKRRTTNHEVILRAIAQGYQSRVQLTRVTGIPKEPLLDCLRWLKSWRLVELCLPLKGSREREIGMDLHGWGRFYLRDPYLRFYFRFIEPSLKWMEQGQTEAVWRHFQRHFWPFVGKTVFQEQCREWIWKQGGTPELSFLPERVRFHWNEKVPVDITAINWKEKGILLGACRWDNHVVDQSVIRDIVEKASLVVPDEEWQAYYIIFSRAGFTAAARVEAENAGIWLVDLEMLERALGKRSVKGGVSSDS